MPDHSSGLDCVTARFPDQAAMIRRLCLCDRSFRILCEDYALAHICLGRFEELGHAAHALEINDYRAVIHALEDEIARFFIRSL